ncbi:hypothetical protein [Pseudomonas sp. XWY-1]|uniref:hypothetical protein n=1 Tax=Pseudomonas sp. XWY-1 TaxID=2069256 RepID=UPI00131A3399|nr:hypothetical protein [Pseudomonas sp. XWY-1]
MKLPINYVLVPVLESALIKSVSRIIDINHSTGQALIIGLEYPLKKPGVIGIEEISYELEQGILRVEQDLPAAYMLKDEDELSDKEKLSREKAILYYKLRYRSS